MTCYQYSSQSLTATSGSTVTFPLDFLPTRAPDGGRLVIERLIIRSDIQIDTDGSTTIAAGGYSALHNTVLIQDAFGVLVQASGPILRAQHYLENGRQAYPDPAAIAISQSNTARVIRTVYDFRPLHRALRGWDYACPAETLRQGQVQVNVLATASFGTGAGVTMDSHTMQLIVQARSEADNQVHLRRELRTLSPSSVTDYYIPVNGALLRSAYLFKPADAATGGATIDATSVTIDALGISAQDPDEFQLAIANEGLHGAGTGETASTTDPWAQAVTLKVLPLVWPRVGGKQSECIPHSGQIYVKSNNTVTSTTLVYELVQPNTGATTRIERSRGSSVRVKTEGKTMRDPADWGRLGRFMPLKVR